MTVSAMGMRMEEVLTIVVKIEWGNEDELKTKHDVMMRMMMRRR